MIICKKNTENDVIAARLTKTFEYFSFTPNGGLFEMELNLMDLETNALVRSLLYAFDCKEFYTNQVDYDSDDLDKIQT